MSATEVPRDPVSVAISSPLALAAMTKIVVPQKSDSPEGTELLVGKPEAWKLWPKQIEAMRLVRRHRRVIVLKARQIGMTWTMALYALWYVMTNPATEVTLVSIGEREAKAVVKRIKFLYRNLPDVIRESFPVARDTELIFAIKHREGAATISSLPSTGTAGRGETTNVLICDEGAHWEDAEERLAALLPAAEDVGQTIILSTANGVGGTFYKTWHGREQQQFAGLFVGALDRPDRDAEWLKGARARQSQDGMDLQEYPLTAEEAFISSGRCAFKTDRLKDYLRDYCRPHKRRGFIERPPQGVTFVEDERKGNWRVWKWRERGRRYLITGDPVGSGSGIDWASMGVYDIDAMEQVAVFHAKPEPTEFATIMARASYVWKDDQGFPALVAPEANGEGRAVVAILRERGHPNLWTMDRIDQRRDAKTEHYGWLTTTATRPIMLAALKEMFTDFGILIRDEETIAECFTFEVNARTNKEEAREGEHDDRVMQTAMAAAILQREAARGNMRRAPQPEDLQPYRQPASSIGGY